jgi:hypothetical protein
MPTLSILRRLPPHTTTAHTHQIAAAALLGLVPEATANVEFIQEEGTADNELIVGLIDSLSIGNSDNESMEDPAGDAADGNGADGDEADGNREDRNAALNGLQKMDQWLHQFDIIEKFFDDVAGNIKWGGDDYDGTSLFDAPDLAEGSDKGSYDGSAWQPRREA